MRRKRYQRGSLQKRKHGRHWVWVAIWREGEHRPSKVLGHCSELARGAAESMLADIVRPLNQGSGMAVQAPCSFSHFVEKTYLPHCRRTWKESTAGTSQHSIESHLIPAFGTTLLHNVRRDDLQDFLEAKSERCSGSVVRHLRWFLNAIFKLAVSDGLIPVNPAAELRIPRRCKPGRSLRPLDEGEINGYLEALNLRERLAARFAIFEGMRPGEILALRWRNIQSDKLVVEQRVYRQKFDSPKNGKSREGCISAGTLRLLNEWRNIYVGGGEDGFVFPSENSATPISLDNLWRRSMKPKLDTVELGWATFQILRKTNASLSKKHGADPKVAADQRGHGIGVSLQVYTSSDMGQKREAVQKLDDAVRLAGEQKRANVRAKVA